MLLISKCVLSLQYVPCSRKTSKQEEDSQHTYGVICQAGIFDQNLGSESDSYSSPDDSSCLTGIPLDKTIIEYRYHLEHNLDTREVSCEMADEGTHVDYRRGKIYTNLK